MIAVTFSLPDESRAFLRSVKVSKRVGGGVGSAIYGTLSEVPLVVWHIGVGRQRAALEAVRLRDAVRLEGVICAGYGGALQPGMEIGEIVSSTEDDLGAARIHTAELIVEKSEEKRRLGLATGARAVDMETSVLRGVFGTGLRFFHAARAISDRMEDDLPVPMAHWFDLDQQRPRVLPLLSFLLRNPGRIAPFTRFVRGLSVARENLARHLVTALPALHQSIQDSEK